MINIPAILVANGIGIIMLFSLLVNVKKTRSFSPDTARIFSLMLLLNTAQCILEPVTFLINGQNFAGCREMGLILNGLLFINTSVFSYLWVLYVDLKITLNRKRSHNLYCLWAVPCIVVGIATVANCFIPIFFTITPDNVYLRTDFFFVPYVVTYFYLLFGAVSTFEYKDKVGKYLFLPALFFLLPVFVGSVLQFAFYGFSLIWACTAIGMTNLYISVQNEISYIDALSGLFTRQYMNGYLKTLLGRVVDKRQVAGIMLDIDRFKTINDLFGHIVGDDAIKNAGTILRGAVNGNGIATRFAGDEFVIIISIADEKEITDLIRKIQHDIDEFNAVQNKPYQLNFSIGYGTFDRNKDTIETFLARMDGEMYLEKRRKAEEYSDK